MTHVEEIVERISDENLYAAVLSIVKEEGGAVHDLDGDGKWTICGIRQHLFPNCPVFSNTAALDKQVKYSFKQTFRICSLSAVFEFYSDYLGEDHKELWYNDFRLGIRIAHHSVMSGHPRARKTLQYAINVLSATDEVGGKLKVDGLIGPRTRDQLEAMYAQGFENMLPDVYSAMWLRFLNRIIARNPKYDRFVIGWLNRIDRVAEQSLLSAEDLVENLEEELVNSLPNDYSEDQR